MSLLRPNTAQVIRPTKGARTNSGGFVPGTSTIYTALPCLIDQTLITLGRLGQSTATGPVVESTHVLYADGVKVSGYSAGAHVTVRGIDMVVSANLRGAFPDIQRNDQIIAEDNRAFLVLKVTLYYDIYPNIQVELAEGKASS
jgi:hypothetical protein